MLKVEEKKLEHEVMKMEKMEGSFDENSDVSGSSDDSNDNSNS